MEDQHLVRRGLVGLLEPEEQVEVVGEAKDGVEALREIPRVKPNVALVDARMPRMDGIELIRRLAEEHPRVAAIVLTTFDDDEYVFGGLRAGAKGYLLKDTSPEDLVSAIRKASRGETVLGGPVASRLVSELVRSPDSETGSAASEDPLSERETRGSQASRARGDQRGDSPRALHKRRDGQEQRLKDPAQARLKRPHPARAIRRRALAEGTALRPPRETIPNSGSRFGHRSASGGRVAPRFTPKLLHGMGSIKFRGQRYSDQRSFTPVGRRPLATCPYFFMLSARREKVTVIVTNRKSGRSPAPGPTRSFPAICDRHIHASLPCGSN